MGCILRLMCNFLSSQYETFRCISGTNTAKLVMGFLAQFGPTSLQPKLIDFHEIFKKDFWGGNRTLLVTICTASCVIVLTMSKIYKSNKKCKNSKSEPKMKGLGIKCYQGIDAICILEDLPIPRIERPDDVLIKVKSSAIDPIDFKIITGYNKNVRLFFSRHNQGWDGEFPLILGRDCSGVVIAVGDDVSEFKQCDEVWAISPTCQQGYMSEYIAIPKIYVDHKPKNLTYEAAAVMPYSATIAWNALVRHAKLGPTSTKSKRVLIHDGSSEVGLLAIQLVKVWGGHVTTTVKRAAIPKAIKMGVNDIIVHDIDDFTKELQKRKKFDVILNTAGTILHEQCKEICNPDGIILSLVSSLPAGEKHGILFGILHSIFAFLKNAFMQKIINGNNIWWSNTEMTAASLYEIRQLIESEKIGPTVDSIWEMCDYVKAFQHAARSPTCGKVVVRIEESI